MKPMSSGSTEI